jgi:hypothetical protein
MKFFLPFLILLTLLMRSGQAQSPAQASEVLPMDVDEQTTGVEIRRGLPTSGNRELEQFRRIITSIQDGMEGDPLLLTQYTKLFVRELINDPRTFAVHVTAEHVAGRHVRLSGYVPYSENKQSLLKLFEYLEFEVQDEVEVLPSENLNGNLFALVQVPSTFSYDKPTSPRETMTQSFLGEPIFLLRKGERGHYLAATHDGYVGYIAAEDLLLVDRKKFARRINGKQALLRADYRSEDLFIPAGARLLHDGQSEDRVHALLPDGAPIDLPAHQVKILDGTVPFPISNALDVAHQKLGSRYVWGGKNSEGVDCSGLVQSSFRTQGVYLPRDTYMQAYVGTLSATRWFQDGMRAGDLLFFLGRNGRINHVAISTGGLDYIEAAGEVKLGSLDPESPHFDERRAGAFAFAKRVLE